jgi:hypothetical protein
MRFNTYVKYSRFLRYMFIFITDLDRIKTSVNTKYDENLLMQVSNECHINRHKEYPNKHSS